MPRLQWILCLWTATLPLVSIADHLVVENPAEPPIVETWSLREVWRLDCEEDESLPLIGVVTQAVVDKRGHVLLLDSQLAHVLEIGPDGEFLGTLGRSGQGPGELENPSTLFLAADEQIGLVQAYPGKIVFLNRDDTPAGTTRIDGVHPAFFRARERSGHLVVSGHVNVKDAGENARSENRRFIEGISREGETGHIFHSSIMITQWDPPISDETGAWFPSRVWDQGPDGSVVIAPDREAYRLAWFGPDGSPTRTIERRFSAYRRTKEDKNKVSDRMRMYTRGGEVEPKKIILDTEPALTSVLCMDDGSLWVQSCYAERELPEGVATRYDVFDPEGRLVKEVRVALDFNRDKDYYELLPDGRFLWYRGMKSAVAARFASVESGEELDEEPVPVQIVLMERAP